MIMYKALEMCGFSCRRPGLASARDDGPVRVSKPASLRADHDLAPLGGRKVHRRVILSGRDSGLFDLLLDGVLEGAVGVRER